MVSLTPKEVVESIGRVAAAREEDRRLYEEELSLHRGRLEECSDVFFQMVGGLKMGIPCGSERICHMESSLW